MSIELIYIGGLVLIFCAVLTFVMAKSKSRDGITTTLNELKELTSHLSNAQSEISGRISQHQSSFNERLENLSKGLNDGFAKQSERASKSIADLDKNLQVRMEAIKDAQKTMTNLSEEMVGLQNILDNKQARGAFGETQLRDLVVNMLPPSIYQFQATLSNGKIVDCLLKLENPPGPIGIDSKFPLESYQRLCEAIDDEGKKRARVELATAVSKHIQDISQKYIISGETAESALMFLPSEAVFAELHTNLRQVVEKSHTAKVFIASPTTLMALLTTIRSVLKDVSMRKQAGVIQSEVSKMLGDVGLMSKRVGKLEQHINLTAEDLRQIRISTDKVTKRGESITEIEVATGSEENENITIGANQALTKNNE